MRLEIDSICKTIDKQTHFIKYFQKNTAEHITFD